MLCSCGSAQRVSLSDWRKLLWLCHTLQDGLCGLTQGVSLSDWHQCCGFACTSQDAAQQGAAAGALRKRQKRTAPAPALDIESNWARFYHARTGIQMTRAEVEAILADPRSAPDSDDDEDPDDWKARSCLPAPSSWPQESRYAAIGGLCLEQRRTLLSRTCRPASAAQPALQWVLRLLF
jgi:hypothetical protein